MAYCDGVDRSVVGKQCGGLRSRVGRSCFVALAVLVPALLLSACGGGSSESDPRVLDAGQVDIKLPPGYKVVNNTVVVPKRNIAKASTTDAASTADSAPQTPAQRAGAGGVTPTTAKSSVPLSSDKNPTADLLKALPKFRMCLDDLGVKFIGGPDASNPDSPTNDPTYLKNLGTCAARSQIVQALQAAQAEQDTLTPAQIKERNKGYLAWRKCMIQRGWKIAQPTPDSKGRLFAFGGNNGPQIEAPPGKDLISSDDVQQCATKAQKVIEGNN
jgi:hypothetical protein